MKASFVLTQDDTASLVEMSLSQVSIFLKRGKYDLPLQKLSGCIVGIPIRTSVLYARTHGIELPVYIKEGFESLSQNTKGE